MGLALLSAAAQPAAAQFVPGHIFVSRPSGEFCMVEGYPDRIWEINPDTGEATLFAEFSPGLFDRADCGFLTGLAFTPDGCQLLASSLLTSEIRAFDSTGNWKVALDAQDGIAAPLGSNNLAFDRDGNLYVVNAGSDTILRFPPDGGPAVVFANRADGVQGDGPIAIAANGDLYYGNTEVTSYILRIRPSGQASIFDDYGNSDGVLTLAADRFGRIYVSLIFDDIVWFDGPDVSTKTPLFAGASVEVSVMTINPFDTALYGVSRVPQGIQRIDVPSGAMTMVASFPAVPHPGGFGGIAVVPTDLRDANLDGEVNLPDWATWSGCYGIGSMKPHCQAADFDRDRKLDLRDFALFQNGFGRIFPSCP